MPTEFALKEQALIGFVASSDPNRARHFYGEILGLPLLDEQLPFALVFDAHGTMLRVSFVRQVQSAPYTVLGWEVTDIATATRVPSAAGVRFERYPGLDQDEFGVWTAPGGAKVAWFKDPDGNILSLSQHG